MSFQPANSISKNKRYYHRLYITKISNNTPKRSSFAHVDLRDRLLTLGMRNLEKHKNIADHEIEKKISVILQIYFILLLLVVFALLFKVSEMGDANFWKIGKPIVSLIVIGSICWGLII